MTRWAAFGKSPRSRGALAVVVAALCGGLLTACGDDTTTGAEVTMLTHDSFELPDSVFEEFRQDTGLTLKVVRSGDAGQLASTVSLTPGSPKADVVFGIDNTFASRPIDAGALEPYESPQLAGGASDYAIGDSHELTAIDHADVCLNIDDTWYEEQSTPKPTALRDLTDPRYAGQSVLLDPATSSPGMAFLLSTIATDPTGWQDYWRAVTGNGAKIVGGWEVAYNNEFSGGEGTGDRPIVLSYASSPAASPGTSAILDGCFAQVEYAGILKGAANESGARKVIDFLLSPTVQRELPDNMFVYPVQRDVPLPAEWQKSAPAPATTVTVPPADIAANREQWLQQWRDAVGR